MLKLLKISITSIIILLFTGLTFAQSTLQLKFEVIGEKGKVVLENEGKIDSIYLEKSIAKKLNQQYYQGFLSAKFIECSSENGVMVCRIARGPAYLLEKLTPGNVDKAILERSGYKENQAPFRLNELQHIFKDMLDYAENNGYPFAIVKLDSIVFTDSGIEASLNLFKGPMIVYDDISIKGNDIIKKSWLENYLEIKEGQLYSEKEVSDIKYKLKELPFITLVEPPTILFTSTTAKIELNLLEKKVNNVDGVIGFLPNQREEIKMLVTGSFNLHLFNLFSTAKELHIDWQKVNVNSQTLNTSIYYPSILKMPIGLSFDFNLLKEDTLYLNRYAFLKIDFNLKPRHKVFFTSLFESSGLLGQASGAIDQPNIYNDYQINYYGIAYRINLLDNNTSPSAGTFINISTYTGAKKFSQMEVDPDTENVQEVKTTQYKFESHVEHYFQLAKGYQLKLKFKSGNIIGDHVFKNDLFRIGGLRTIRGFNENYFFTSDYAFTNLEFRIMQNADTYFFIFYDQAIVYDRTISQDIDYPIGSGLGFNLGSKSGLFSLVIGMGKSSSQIFSLNSAKIHFGYLGRF